MSGGGTVPVSIRTSVAAAAGPAASTAARARGEVGIAVMAPVSALALPGTGVLSCGRGCGSPQPGARDAFELVTRAVTGGCFRPPRPSGSRRGAGGPAHGAQARARGARAGVPRGSGVRARLGLLAAHDEALGARDVARTVLRADRQPVPARA